MLFHKEFLVSGILDKMVYYKFIVPFLIWWDDPLGVMLVRDDSDDVSTDSTSQTKQLSLNCRPHCGPTPAAFIGGRENKVRRGAI